MHFPVQYPILWKSWISWVIVQFLYHHVQYPMSSFKKSWVENVIVFSTAAWRSADICCTRPRRLAIWEAWWEWCHHFGIFWIFLEYVEHVKNTTYGSKKKQAMKYFTTSVEKKCTILWYLGWSRSQFSFHHRSRAMGLSSKSGRSKPTTTLRSCLKEIQLEQEKQSSVLVQKWWIPPKSLF